MRKYLYVIKATLLDQAAYPTRFFFHTLNNGAILILFYFLFTEIFKSRSQIVGFSKNEMITYYVITYVVRQLTVSGKVARVIKKAIHMGELSALMIKPLSFNPYVFIQQITEKITSTTFSITIIFLLTFFLHTIFIRPQHLSLLIVSLMLAMLINYFIYALIGTIGFWTVNTWGILSIFGRMVDIFSGSVFPLDFLPHWIYQLTQYLPFQYMHYIVISIYLNKLDYPTIITSLAIQSLWVLVLYITYRQLWQNGLRHYEAVGQ